MRVVDRPVTTIDLLATICRALGIDPSRQNISNVGRPIPLVAPEAQPVADVLL
jgi:arylsulfatase A-like enzyme